MPVTRPAAHTPDARCTTSATRRIRVSSGDNTSAAGRSVCQALAVSQTLRTSPASPATDTKTVLTGHPRARSSHVPRHKSCVTSTQVWQEKASGWPAAYASYPTQGACDFRTGRCGCHFLPAKISRLKNLFLFDQSYACCSPVTAF